MAGVEKSEKSMDETDSLRKQGTR